MRIVLTGGPCCGKTTLLRELQKRGYETIDETARKVLSARKSPSTKEEWEELESTLFLEQIKAESSGNYSGAVVLDRSLIDAVAYSKYFTGRMPKGSEAAKLHGIYDLILMPDLLPFEKDGLRSENEHLARELHRELATTYASYGYSIVRIPVLETIEKRVSYALEKIKEHEKN